jgi:hypothetical protein
MPGQKSAAASSAAKPEYLPLPPGREQMALEGAVIKAEPVR